MVLAVKLHRPQIREPSGSLAKQFGHKRSFILSQRGHLTSLVAGAPGAGGPARNFGVPNTTHSAPTSPISKKGQYSLNTDSPDVLPPPSKYIASQKPDQSLAFLTSTRIERFKNHSGFTRRFGRLHRF